MNEYYHLLQKLYSMPLKGRTPLSLERMCRLSALYNNPHGKFLSVHVAGSNGKGSVSAKISKGLQGIYKKVGLYTSPHISCFRERIQINGEMINEADTIRLLNEIIDLPGTFFELTTLLAFRYFAEKGVEIAVLETGLGGKFDSTNIITPILTIITSIALEHTAILGNTLEKIAEEKKGIIKPNIPVVLGPRAAPLIIPIQENNSAFELHESSRNSTITNGSISTQYGPFCDRLNPKALTRPDAPLFSRNGITPSIQSPVLLVKEPEKGFLTVEEENRAIAQKALEFFKVPQKAIQKALTTRLPCRLERFFYENQEVILDVAHNPDGLRRLFEELSQNEQKFIIICGLSIDKNLEECLKIIGKHAREIHFVKAPNIRGTPVLKLKEELLSQIRNQKNALLRLSQTDIFCHSTIKQGIRCALKGREKEAKEHPVLVTGTFFIMSEVRHFLGIEEPRDLIEV